MMGNVWEWMESPYGLSYGTGSPRGLRGGSFRNSDINLPSSGRYDDVFPYEDIFNIGFRVASEIPEPSSLALLGGLLVIRRRRGWN
jgi:formylglycine-generating enzyme required for sulfatase activity